MQSRIAIQIKTQYKTNILYFYHKYVASKINKSIYYKKINKLLTNTICSSLLATYYWEWTSGQVHTQVKVCVFTHALEMLQLKQQREEQ